MEKSILSIRKFNFYDGSYVESYKSNISATLNSDSIISCVTGARKFIVLATTDGYLLAIDKLFDHCIFNFKAYDNDITHIVYNRKHRLLFLLGMDNNSALNSTIKIFDIQNMNNENIPQLVNGSILSINKRKSMILSMCVDEKMNTMVIGYDDGTIGIIRNDIIYMKKQKSTILKEFKVPITGLNIIEAGSHTNLFITTTECVAVYDLSFKDSLNKCMILDNVNVPLKNCCIWSYKNTTQELVVATNDAIQSYTPEGRCQYLPFGGEKSHVKCARDNVICVTSTYRAGKTNSNNTSKQEEDAYQIIIIGFNSTTKYFAYQKQVSSRVIDIVYEWGCFFVFLQNGQLLKIISKDFETRLNFLYKKNLYMIALNMAKDSGDHKHVVDTYKRYGDHLFSQGDMKNSMKQFIETIGYLEPSYVIHKFLDAQNMNYLTAYLEKLHELDLALVEHTTLLLNCYIKLNDIDNLDKFLDQQENTNFDLETAIKVCYQAKLYHHALKLSIKCHNNVWHLKILVEDLKDYNGAMEYITSCSNLFDICDSLKKYGKLLLTHLPHKILDCLKKIVVVYPNCDIHQFLHIFIGNDIYLKEFLEFIIKTNSNCDPSIYNLLIELYVNEYTSINDPAEKINHEIRFINILNQYQSFLDLDHLLMILHASDLAAGIVWIYEKKQLFHELLYYYDDRNDFESIISLCKKYSEYCPSLWKLALSRISSKMDHSDETNCEKYIKIIMGCLQHENSIHPINVLQTMQSHSNAVTFGNIKEYFTSHLEMTENKLKTYKEKIDEQREEINNLESSLKNMNSGVKIFQNSKCSICTKVLELPCTHYLCGHSFHNSCCENFNGNEDSCPICQRKMKLFTDNNNIDFKKLNSDFLKEASNNPDQISLFEKYLKLGLFSGQDFI